ncbi:unnamed protein product, partial [Dovyalis caffra]
EEHYKATAVLGTLGESQAATHLFKARARPRSSKAALVHWKDGAWWIATMQQRNHRADGKGDEGRSVVSATESDSGEATSLSSTFADFRYQLPDEFSDSQRKELKSSDLRLAACQGSQEGRRNGQGQIHLRRPDKAEPLRLLPLLQLSDIHSKIMHLPFPWEKNFNLVRMSSSSKKLKSPSWKTECQKADELTVALVS